VKRNAAFLAAAACVMLATWAAIMAACALPYLANVYR
jgi:hypothetical protein